MTFYKLRDGTSYNPKTQEIKMKSGKIFKVKDVSKRYGKQAIKFSEVLDGKKTYDEAFPKK